MNLKVIRRVKRKENSQWKGAAGWSETGGRKSGWEQTEWRGDCNTKERWGRFRHRAPESWDKSTLAAGSRLDLSLSPWFSVSQVWLWQGRKCILLTPGFHHIQHGVHLWPSNMCVLSIQHNTGKQYWDYPGQRRCWKTEKRRQKLSLVIIIKKATFSYSFIHTFAHCSGRFLHQMPFLTQPQRGFVSLFGIEPRSEYVSHNTKESSLANIFGNHIFFLNVARKTWFPPIKYL